MNFHPKSNKFHWGEGKLGVVDAGVPCFKGETIKKHWINWYDGTVRALWGSFPKRAGASESSVAEQGALIDPFPCSDISVQHAFLGSISQER